MPAQKQAGHVTLHTLPASKSMVSGQVSAVLLQELCKGARSIDKRRFMRSLITCPQAVDELQRSSDDAEVLKVEGRVLLGQ